MKTSIKHRITAYVVVLLLAGAAFVFAQPTVGISKEAPITGAGTTADKLRLAACAAGSGYIHNGSAFTCTATQQRVTGTCGAGSAVSAVGSDGSVTCTATSSASGTSGRFARFTGATTIGNGEINWDGTYIVPLQPINFQMTANDNAYQMQVIMQDTDHVGEAVAVVGYVNTMTIDATSSGASVIGGQFQAAATRSLGANTIVNIGVQSEAYTGTGVSEAYSWYSQNGFMRNDGGAQLATTAGTGITIGSGASAASDTVQINKAVVVESTKSVTLGSNVQDFLLPGTTSSNPDIRIGFTSGSTAYQLATKNTDTSSATGGIGIYLDTSVIATARGGVGLFRGAGPTPAEVGGLNVAGATNGFASGTAANDIVIHSYDPGSAGRCVDLAAGSGPTVYAKLCNTGTFTALGASGVTSLAATATHTGQTASRSAFTATNTGTYDATAAGRSSYAVNASNTSTRSAGANNVTGYGVYATSSGAQVNYSGYFDQGLFVVQGAASFGSTITAGPISVSQILENSGSFTISSCGTSPGDGLGGRLGSTITMGTGSPSSCTITFTSAFSNTPTCLVTSVGNTTVRYISAVSSSAITVTNIGGGSTPGEQFAFFCLDHL